ncbi:hypothetical protein VTK73DRAFT_3135 [Phialemonium thermophilum]|uniref:Translation initiation factor eIF2B subunit beta n=1 Tax=Phialemonium thermophilum TaxID=223376 RepID=A0ABR3X0E9_9PEZI
MAPVQVGYAPTLEKFLKSLKGQSLDASVEALVYLLKRKQVKGAEPVANATARILLQVVAKSKWSDVDQLLANVQKTGAKLAQAAPRELVIGNIVRRVMGLIRDEATEDRTGNEFGSESVSDIQSLPGTHSPVPRKVVGTNSLRPLVSSGSFHVSKSLFNLLSAADPAESTTSGGSPTAPAFQSQSSSVHALRSEVIDGIEEIMDEVSQADDQIASFAEIQIHPDDYVLVHQPSPTVERFLVRAAAKRHFTVLIASSTPHLKDSSDVPYGSLRKKLGAAGVKAIHVLSSGVAAYMSKVNKVILGASAVLADGAIVSDAGTHLIARAAHEFSKPVIVLSGVYKLCPEAVYDPESAVELGDPSRGISFEDGVLVEGVEVEYAVTEFVPPGLIDTYITNLGPHTRDHLDDIMADHYKQEDVDLPLQ